MNTTPTPDLRSADPWAYVWWYGCGPWYWRRYANLLDQAGGQWAIRSVA